MNPRSKLRIVVVALLLVAAYWTAQPWIACATPPNAFLPEIGPLLGACTAGLASKGSAEHFSGYYLNLVGGSVYLAAAIFAALTKRPL